MTEQKLNLKRIRLMSGMTQKELAKIAGVNQNSLTKYEAGTRTPRPETAKRIADALGFDWKKFYPGDDYITVEKGAK